MIHKAAIIPLRRVLTLGFFIALAGMPLDAAFQSQQIITMGAAVTFGSPSSPSQNTARPNLATTPATNAYPVSGILQIGGIVSQSPVSLAMTRLARPSTGTDSYQDRK